MLLDAITTPRSCDAVDLTDTSPSWLVWVVDDRGVAVVRSAPTLTAALVTGRAYSAAWNGRVVAIEDPTGTAVPEDQWSPFLESDDPLPHIYTVELRSSPLAGRDCVSALWTTTDLSSAVRHRALLPDHLRRRTLIVSNAPDGAVTPRLPIPTSAIERASTASTVR